MLKYLNFRFYLNKVMIGLIKVNGSVSVISYLLLLDSVILKKV